MAPISLWLRNPTHVTAAGFDTLLARTSAQLLATSGVPDAGIKHDVLASRIAEALIARGGASLCALLDRAENGDEPARHELRNLLTINYSRFWREPEHWPILAEHLCLRIRTGEPTRLWSAACAHGEEAWTIALVAAEVASRFPQFSPGWDWQVLGTDIDTRALASASAGRYMTEELGSLPPRMRAYLLPGGTPTRPHWAVPPALLPRVGFSVFDLARPEWTPPAGAPFDAIFLSNVLIYHDRETQERILHNIADCLRPDGILFTSRIEGNLGLATARLKAAGSCTYITARTARRP